MTRGWRRAKQQQAERQTKRKEQNDRGTEKDWHGGRTGNTTDGLKEEGVKKKCDKGMEWDTKI